MDLFVNSIRWRINELFEAWYQIKNKSEFRFEFEFELQFEQETKKKKRIKKSWLTMSLKFEKKGGFDGAWGFKIILQKIG